MPEQANSIETDRFIENMDAQLLGWEQPVARLREALDYDHFRLYAQAIVGLAPASATARPAAMAEVLVRLREEETRMLPPGDFLPAFEHYRMMVELDRWVVRNALRVLGEDNRIKTLSVNVSAQTIEEPGFAPFVAVQLRLAMLAPAALVIEIDESDVLDRRAATERFAAEIKSIGCPLLVDGFARRAVSFEPLKALLADFVKVDGTVSRNILRSESAAAKLKEIVRFGEVNGTKVIAECVEEAAVLAELARSKVGYAQGFGVRKPEPIESLFETAQ